MNKKELLLISVGIFLTVVAWLISDIYHAAFTEKIKTRVDLPTLQRYDIDTTVLQTLQEKKQ